MKALVAALVGATALAAGSLGVPAQIVRGRVVDAQTLRGIHAVDVSLRDSAGTRLRGAISDSTGAFVLLADSAGTYRLVAERIGYATTRSKSLEVDHSEEVLIELRLGTEAIQFEPMVIVARRSERLGRLSEFYDRVDWGNRTGFGRFITRADIEGRIALQTTDLLRTVSGVRIDGRTRSVLMTRSGGGCTPAVYIDGMHMNRGARATIDEYVHPEMVEGIEVYRGATETPVQYQDRAGCGSILIWTRQGKPSGKPFSWWRLAIGGGAFLALLLFLR